MVTKKRSKMPSDAIIIEKFNNGDVFYAVNFEFGGREYHHVNHIDRKGKIKHNIIYLGKYKEKEYA